MERRIKTLHVTENDLQLWVEYENDQCHLHVTDPIQNVTHDIADYCGGRYVILNPYYFNEVFIKIAKSLTYKTSDGRVHSKILDKIFNFIDGIKEEDGEFYELRIRSKCFKRRAFIFFRRSYLKIKRFIND